MRTSVSRYFKDNLVGFLALFVALGGTGAYAANTIGSTDIIDGQVNSADVKDQSLTTFDVSTFLGADVVDGTLTGADVQDGSLVGQDIGDNTFSGRQLMRGSVTRDAVLDGNLGPGDVGSGFLANFAATIGTVNANNCVNREVSGAVGSVGGKHLLLTPSLSDANGALMYGVKYDTTREVATIHVCNWSNATIDDGTTHFNLLAFNTQ